MQRTNNPNNLIHAHFFFVGIVGLSDQSISVQRQIKKIEALNNLISSCQVFKEANPDSMLISQTGEGLSIGFLENPAYPLQLAIELHKKLKSYNKGKYPEEQLRISIGLNDGPVYVAKDVHGNPNLWGPGLILAKRVMDIGDDGHILMTARMAEVLRELSDEYKVLIKPLRDYNIKHGQVLLLYSAYGNGVGNSKIPVDRTYQKSKISTEMAKRKLIMIYNKVDVTLTVTDHKQMLVHHKRSHAAENIAEEPIEMILHGITTDVPKSFAALNIKTSDETGKSLKITSINLDKPYQKEFTTALNNAIYRGEKGRSYTLEYDVEEPERYFENYFPIGCKKYTMSLIYPSKTNFKPTVYDVNVEKETKSKSKSQPVTSAENDFVKATWTRANVLESQAFRLEW